MGDEVENIFAELEAAVAAWNARAGKAHHGVLRAIADGRERLNSVARMLDVQRSLYPSLVTARIGLDAVEQSPEERRRCVDEAVSAVAELGMYLGTFERALEGLLEQANTTVRAGEQLMERLLAIRGEGSPVLSAESDALIAYETGTGPVSLPSEREADLQDRVSALRTELAAAREAHANAKNHEAEVVATAREEIAALRERIDALQGELDSARRGVINATALSPGATGDTGAAPNAAPVDPYRRMIASVRDEHGQKRRMGQILVEAQVISQDQLDEALIAKQAQGNRHLGQILVDKGYTSHTRIAQALAAQTEVPFIHLRESNIDPRALRVVTPQLARRHTCLPFHIDREVLSVAMANPLDLVALDDLQLAVRQRVQPYAAAMDEIEEAIRRHYRTP